MPTSDTVCGYNQYEVVKVRKTPTKFYHIQFKGLFHPKNYGLNPKPCGSNIASVQPLPAPPRPKIDRIFVHALLFYSFLRYLCMTNQIARLGGVSSLRAMLKLGAMYDQRNS